MICSMLLLTQIPRTIERDLALQGRDPISLLDGRSVVGFPSLSASHGAFIYQFESKENLQKFKSNPERYGLQIGGACGNMGPLTGRGRGQFYTVWDGRIWQFASPQCKQNFLRNPHWYDDKPIALSKGTPQMAREGKRLIEKVVAAHGGAQAFANIERMTWTQEVTAARKEDSYTKTYGQDRKLGTAYGESGDGWGYKSIANGLHAVQFGEAFVMPLVESEQRFLKNLVGKHVILLLKDRNQPSFQALAPGKVSKSGEIDLLIHYRQDRVTLIIDAKSSRIIRSYTTSRLLGPNQLLTTTYGEWKTQAGVLVPGVTTFKATEGKPGASVVWGEPKINRANDAALFSIPESVRQAR